MKNEEYLLRLSRVMEKNKDDVFVNFANELFHKVSDNYDLLDIQALLDLVKLLAVMNLNGLLAML